MPSPAGSGVAGLPARTAVLAMETFTMLAQGMQAFRFNRTPGDEAIRVGLIGYGLAGRYFHAPLIAAVPGLRLMAVVTRDATRAAQARAEHPGVRVVETVESLWSSGDLELVVVATPNRMHAPLATAALDAGLHVVVDKPLAGDSATARGLVERAASRDRILTVFQNRRWDGDFLTVRGLVEEGRLGRVLRFESRFERWRPEPKPGWRQSATPGDAGGLLYDLGTHLIDQALVLFGPVSGIYAELVGRSGDGAVDADTFVALRHASGVRSHLWMSELAAQAGPRFRVLGTQSAFAKWGLDVQEARLRAGERPHPGWSADPESAWGRLGADTDNVPVATEHGRWITFYEELVAAVRAGAPVPVDPQDAVSVLEVIEVARAVNEEA